MSKNTVFLILSGGGLTILYLVVYLRSVLFEDFDPYEHVRINRVSDLVSGKCGGFKRILHICAYENWRSMMDKTATLQGLGVFVLIYLIGILTAWRTDMLTEIQDWVLALFPALLGVLGSAIELRLKVLQKRIRD